MIVRTVFNNAIVSSLCGKTEHTFNNIPVVSWQSALLVEETGVHNDNLYHITLYRVHLAWARFELERYLLLTFSRIIHCNLVFGLGKKNISHIDNIPKV